MKNCWIFVVLALLLSGCGVEATMETVADELVAPVMAQPRQVTVDLPEDAVTPVLESESRQIYMSEGYEITVETFSSGDLQETVHALSGYDRENLTVMETVWEDVTRYEFVWAAAGEQGDRLGRGVILDDGQYHYCMSVLRDANLESQIVWEEVFQSFALS